MTKLKYPSETTTNTLSRLENGAISNLPRSVTEKADRPSLCSHCPRASCSDRSKIANLTASTAVMSCSRFIPTLYFSVNAGLEGAHWNTIRLGRAWDQRLRPGQTVAIADSKSKKMLHLMTVDRVVTGTVTEILRDHSFNNHAIQAERERGLISESVEAARERLERILINAYGRNYVAPDRQSTAVYLERT